MVKSVDADQHTDTQTHSYLLIYVDVAGVDAVSEKVFCAAVTAAQVAVVKQLPARTHKETHTNLKNLLGIDPGEDQPLLCQYAYIFIRACVCERGKKSLLYPAVM